MPALRCVNDMQTTVVHMAHLLGNRSAHEGAARGVGVEPRLVVPERVVVQPAIAHGPQLRARGRRKVRGDVGNRDLQHKSRSDIGIEPGSSFQTKRPPAGHTHCSTALNSRMQCWIKNPKRDWPRRFYNKMSVGVSEEAYFDSNTNRAQKPPNNKVVAQVT